MPVGCDCGSPATGRLAIVCVLIALLAAPASGGSTARRRFAHSKDKRQAQPQERVVWTKEGPFAIRTVYRGDAVVARNRYHEATGDSVCERSAEIESMRAAIASLTREVSELRKEKKQTDEISKDLSELREEQGLLAAEQKADKEDAKPRTHIYGLTDVLLRNDTRPTGTTSFDLKDFYLMAQSQVSPRWSARGDISIYGLGNYVAGQTGNGEIRLSRGFLTYRGDEQFNLHIGKIFVPWGLWNKIHWRPRVPTVTRPLSLDNELLVKTALGVDTFGRLRGEHLDTNYSVFVFNDKKVGTDGLDLNNNQWVLGDLEGEFKGGFKVGVSGAFGRNSSKADRHETAGVLYAKGFLDKKKRLELWTEAVSLVSDPVRMLDVWGQIQWEFVRKYRLCLRADTLDTDEVSGRSQRHDRMVYSLNHKPNPSSIFSLEVVRDEFEDPRVLDYTTTILRVGTMFGGL